MTLKLFLLSSLAVLGLALACTGPEPTPTPPPVPKPTPRSTVGPIVATPLPTAPISTPSATPGPPVPTPTPVPSPTPTPRPTPGPTGATYISAGDLHTCAITTEGGVRCWGSNDSGQLGDGTTTDRATPVYVVGLESGVAAVSAGTNHTCALISDGGVKCWGTAGGILGDGTANHSSIPVDVVGLSTGVMAVSAGSSSSCVLTTAGGVKCWGSNGSGHLGDGTDRHRFTPVDVVGLASGVIQISAGRGHACALSKAGGVKCWGIGINGQLGDGASTDRLTPVEVLGLSIGATAVSAGNHRTCALTTQGGVLCWAAPVTGLTDSVVAVDVGDGQCALITGGSVKCWGRNGSVPVDVVGLSSGAVAISVGGGHACALTNVGGVKCWGRNTAGQLGDGTTTDSRVPVDVVGFTRE